MMLPNTLYEEPDASQIALAKSQNKYYKAVYNNGKINHWQLNKINDRKPCNCKGR